MNANDAGTVTRRVALDARALDGLKAQAKASPDKALRQAAGQFETVFMDMLMKSMRATLAQDGPFDSEATRTYTGMLDQQVTQKLSQRGMGLADLMVKQLSRQFAPGKEAAQAGAAQRVERATSEAKTSAGPQSFVNDMLPHAQEAERATGVPAKLILGQAALESGWGKHQIRNADGTTSFNLFGIKAGKGWTGPTTDVVTTEYVNGEPRKVVQKFRAYGSYTEAFADWARLMSNNPRYAKVVEAARSGGEYARAMQQSGYATDPQYAEKLTKVINHTLLKQAFA